MHEIQLVSEVVKSSNNFVITKDGKILGINSVSDKLLNLEVKKIQIVEGKYADYTCIRL